MSDGGAVVAHKHKKKHEKARRKKEKRTKSSSSDQSLVGAFKKVSRNRYSKALMAVQAQLQLAYLAVASSK